MPAAGTAGPAAAMEGNGRLPLRCLTLGTL